MLFFVHTLIIVEPRFLFLYWNFWIPIWGSMCVCALLRFHYPYVLPVQWRIFFALSMFPCEANRGLCGVLWFRRGSGEIVVVAIAHFSSNLLPISPVCVYCPIFFAWSCEHCRFVRACPLSCPFTAPLHLVWVLIADDTALCFFNAAYRRYCVCVIFATVKLNFTPY